ncbi:Other/CAMKK/ELM protein kinase [Mycena indigotica]|uniref:Other/CAMKK/ELM protein kinase n=1 Tax=Mycena indigotica TaxID=2126181 RepID=A0A8H6SPK5_9AGAR|nr:Other/CAMKK/ELM protein kinase [Mycena indigotica]KAF7301645.1 Other/CAMKK/ELM protein kinase [Mycena indigotica]
MDSVPAAPSVRNVLIITRRQIAKGHNSIVYLAERTTDKTLYALKQIPRNNKRTENLQRLRANNPARLLPTSNNLSAPPKGTEEAKIAKEVALMRSCHHPNIVRFQYFIDDKSNDSMYILMEYMEGGELQWRERDSSRPYLTIEQTRRVMRDVILGIGYLHLQGIIHRDIKPSNIFWCGDRSKVKIGDFGVASLAQPDPSDADFFRPAGTPAFLAPEITPGGPKCDVTFAVDLWALGVTLYALLFGSLPFDADIRDAGPVVAENALYRSIREDPWIPPERMSSASIQIASEDWSDGGVLFLLDGLLNKSPEDRFDDEALKVPTPTFYSGGTSLSLPQNMMNYGWLIADMHQPQRWMQDTAPLMDPHPPPRVSPPRATSSKLLKQDQTVTDSRTKWSFSLALGRRVGKLFKSPRDASPADGRGAVMSEPRMILSSTSDKGKGRATAPPNDSPPTSRRKKSIFSSRRNESKSLISTARHSVEALGKSRAPAPTSSSASGGIVLGPGSRTVTVLGQPEQRARSLTSVEWRTLYPDLDDQGRRGDWLVIQDQAQDDILVVMPRRLASDDDDDSGSSDGSSEVASGPEDSDYGEESTQDFYGETSSGDEGGGPIEFRRRVRAEPRHGE